MAAAVVPRPEPLGVFSMAMKVMREEGGVRALYRGLVPTALGVVCHHTSSFVYNSIHTRNCYRPRTMASTSQHTKA
jgi:hypothetical protein